jgi:hypothetical protein
VSIEDPRGFPSSDLFLKQSEVDVVEILCSISLSLLVCSCLDVCTKVTAVPETLALGGILYFGAAPRVTKHHRLRLAFGPHFAAKGGEFFGISHRHELPAVDRRLRTSRTISPNCINDLTNYKSTTTRHTRRVYECRTRSSTELSG